MRLMREHLPDLHHSGSVLTVDFQCWECHTQLRIVHSGKLQNVRVNELGQVKDNTWIVFVGPSDIEGGKFKNHPDP